VSDVTRKQHEALVKQLYDLLLGREPDPEGLQSWIEALESGQVSPAGMVKSFAASPELLDADARYRDQIAKAIAPFQQVAAAGSIVRVESKGCSYLVPENASILPALSSPSGYQPWILPYFLDQCHPGMIVLDIGAGCGGFALPAANRVAPNGRVFAIEPGQGDCRILLRSAEASGIANLTVFPCGISDRLGAELIWRQSGDDHHRMFPTDLLRAADLERHDLVAVLPLDLVRAALPPPQVVRMNIEGMAYRAVSGAQEMIRECRPVVFLKYSAESPLQDPGAVEVGVVEMFRQLNYDLEILHNNGTHEMILNEDRASVVQYVSESFRRNARESHGSGLDLCFRPRARGPRVPQLPWRRRKASWGLE